MTFEGLADILWKGIVPATFAGALIYAGLLIRSVYAWIPILITISLCALLFRHRVQKQIEKDVEIMSKPFVLQSLEESITDYKRYLGLSSVDKDDNA